eukprot:jgi/Bigna1/79744/fgenesh1_pg.65_\
MILRFLFVTGCLMIIGNAGLVRPRDETFSLSGYEEPVEVPVDIHDLFNIYDRVYFSSALTNAGVEVKWGSKMMTKCAGMCEYKGRTASIQIRLSPSLLQYRSYNLNFYVAFPSVPYCSDAAPSSQNRNADVKDTLLHEMIHAYLFLDHTETDRNPNDPYRPFGGYRITVFHSFINEVRHLQTHVWKCEKCHHVIRRAMNRPPSEKDCRAYRKDLSGWTFSIDSPRNRCGDRRCYVHNHIRMCGGAYKRLTPEPPAKKKKKKCSNVSRHLQQIGPSSGKI